MTNPKDGAFGLTVERLRELLSYDPQTGLWTRLCSRGGEFAGSVAGTLKPSGYILIDVDGHRYRAHRLAWFYMTGQWPAGQIDHKDNIRSHNWWNNLRIATSQQNQANCKTSKNNRCGFKGVYEVKRYGRWYAKVNVGHRQIHLGSFSTPAEASAAYAEGARQYFGEYSRAR